MAARDANKYLRVKYLALLWCTMVSEIEARRAKKQNIHYPKQHHTPHCWLPANVMNPANSTMSFSWLTRSTPIFIVEEHSYIMLTRLCFLIGLHQGFLDLGTCTPRGMPEHCQGKYNFTTLNA